MSAHWEEAVAAVEHEPLCRSNTNVTDGGFGSCDCSRDARIAKGIEAAIRTAVRRAVRDALHDWIPQVVADNDATRAAFVEASR